MKRAIIGSLIVALCAAVSCGGKVLVDGLPSGIGAGGAGGAGGSSTTNSTADGTPPPAGATGTTGSVVAATTTGSAQASAAAGGCNPSYTCAEAITPPSGDSKLLCSGTTAYDAYEILIKCTCGGPCSAQCSANLCIGMDVTPSCSMCVQAFGMGCGKEFQDCANN